MEMLLSILFHLNLSNTIDFQSGMSISFRWILILRQIELSSSSRSPLFSERRHPPGQPLAPVRRRGASLEDVYYSWQLARNQTGKVKEWCCLCDPPC